VPAKTFPAFTLFSPGAVLPAAAFELHPSFGLSEEYSDNWFLTDTNKQSNWRTEADLGLSLLINGARTRGSVSTSWGLTYDTVDDEFSPGRALTLAGQIAWDATPLLTLTVTDTLTRSDDPAERDDLNLNREREVFFSNLFSVAADYRLPTWTLSASYLFSVFLEEEGNDTYSQTFTVGATKSFLQRNYLTATYSFLYSETTNEGHTIGNEIALTLGHQINAQTTVGLLGSFAYRTGTDTTEDDYNIATVGVFGSYTVPGVWSGYLALGYSGFDPSSGATDGAPYASATFTYQLARGTFTLTADSGFSETFVTGENLGVLQTWGVTGTFTYPLTPFLRGSASGFYRKNQDVGSSDVGADADEGNTYGATVSLSAPLRSWLNLSVSYDYTKFNATNPGEDYTENRARLSLNASF
jgi:hypothetical protein